MKDNKKIYEIPPKLLPDAANSLSVVLDYSEVKGDEKELKDKMLQDNIVTMFGVSQKMQEDSIMEIKVYGVKDGEDGILLESTPDETADGKGLWEFIKELRSRQKYFSTGIATSEHVIPLAMNLI